MHIVEQLIKQYHLQPHPEGGWYTQTYKSKDWVPSNAMPERFTGSRAFSTAIYFLLEAGNFSAFHRIKSDECWHFYSGDPLQVYIIFPSGKLEIIELGADFQGGELFQYVVPANCWFASRPAAGSSYSFVGCTVSPRFEFADFELAEAVTLQKIYPKHAGIINELCR